MQGALHSLRFLMLEQAGRSAADAPLRYEVASAPTSQLRSTNQPRTARSFLASASYRDLTETEQSTGGVACDTLD